MNATPRQKAPAASPHQDSSRRLVDLAGRIQSILLQHDFSPLRQVSSPTLEPTPIYRALQNLSLRLISDPFYLAQAQVSRLVLNAARDEGNGRFPQQSVVS